MECSQRFEGRVVVVVGGTSGFGLTTAAALVRDGARVVVTGRSTTKVAAATAELGPSASVVRSDATVPADLDALVAQVRDLVGGDAGVDGVFVNAGQAFYRAMAETTEADLDAVLAANLSGPYLAVQRLAPLVVDGGAIVVTTSVVNRLGAPGLSAYAAAKAGVRAMVRTAARELLPRGVRVNAVSPGPIDSGALERSRPGEDVAPARAALTEENPMGRFGRPEEVAAAVRFLLFEATFTTGAELTVDGGAADLA